MSELLRPQENSELHPDYVKLVPLPTPGVIQDYVSMMHKKLSDFGVDDLNDFELKQIRDDVRQILTANRALLERLSASNLSPKEFNENFGDNYMMIEQEAFGRFLAHYGINVDALSKLGRPRKADFSSQTDYDSAIKRYWEYIFEQLRQAREIANNPGVLSKKDYENWDEENHDRPEKVEK